MVVEDKHVACVLVLRSLHAMPSRPARSSLRHAALLLLSVAVAAVSLHL